LLKSAFSTDHTRVGHQFEGSPSRKEEKTHPDKITFRGVVVEIAWLYDWGRRDYLTAMKNYKLKIRISLDQR
jgi:hypothetical protein